MNLNLASCLNIKAHQGRDRGTKHMIEVAQAKIEAFIRSFPDLSNPYQVIREYCENQLLKKMDEQLKSLFDHMAIGDLINVIGECDRLNAIESSPVNQPVIELQPDDRIVTTHPKPRKRTKRDKNDSGLN
jgi:hypothetical protein